MGHTSKDEMRRLMLQAQQLQHYAFNHGINMQINTRDTNTDGPWFTGHASVEGALFSDDDGRTITFDIYNHKSYNDNKATLDSVREFIDKNKQSDED